jgi:hypothetical protein
MLNFPTNMLLPSADTLIRFVWNPGLGASPPALLGQPPSGLIFVHHSTPTEWSELLGTDPEAPVSIPVATRFSEK